MTTRPDHPSRKIAEFLKLVREVDVLTSTRSFDSVENARRLPREARGAIESVAIARSSTDEARNRVEKARTALAAEVYDEGRAERDRLLAAYADRLEAIRAVLPDLAAGVAIELGVAARALRAEAKEQRP